MNVKPILFFFVVSTLGITGCTRNTVVFLSPNTQLSQMDASREVAKPCFLSDVERQKYSPVTPTVIGASFNTPPQKAKDSHVNGCAGAKFQLDQNGKPTNIDIVKENPKNYGFGETLVQDIQKETFKGPTDTSLWFYTSTATVFNAATTSP